MEKKQPGSESINVPHLKETLLKWLPRPKDKNVVNQKSEVNWKKVEELTRQLEELNRKRET